MDRNAFHKLLAFGIERGVSDIHFEVGYPPHYRLHGELLGAIKVPPLTGTDTEAIARMILEDRNLTVDFTRPVYSATRCGLLQFAPTLDASKMTPDAIRDGFKASLAGKPGAAAELLKSLGSKADAAAHTAAAQAFMKACAARPAKDMIADIVARASHLRNIVKTVHSTGGGQAGQGIIEFPETLPVDNLPDSERTFDPTTCTLK